MARLVWSKEALRALDAIALHTEEVAPLQASDLLEHLRASARGLADFPRMGRMIPGAERDWLRELIVDQYRIVYELVDDQVTIATVLHGAQDVAARLHELWPGLE